MALQLPAEQRQRAITSIKLYFTKELEQDIGDLKAGMVLDFFLKEIAPSVYNRAVAEAQAFVRDRLGDLEGVCYHPEFDYWPRTGARRS